MIIADKTGWANTVILSNVFDRQCKQILQINAHDA
jgi:hypothetical protein